MANELESIDAHVALGDAEHSRSVLVSLQHTVIANTTAVNSDRESIISRISSSPGGDAYIELFQVLPQTHDSPMRRCRWVWSPRSIDDGKNEDRHHTECCWK